ncbi:MAG: glycosyltransferase family 9 protein [Pseudomonadales bacterium]|jgi:heptosyltransferase I|nr:glycosyltransferase family 9 protein [Pseudomonadales bacterium]
MKKASFPEPRSICLLRLSAIGDTCHVVPLLRTLQQALPTARFTWVIGRVEARLMRLLPDVEFIEYDKRKGLSGLLALRRTLHGRRFDVLLNLQLALRASVVSLCIPAVRRLGFDRARAREGQWLVTNEKIAPRTNEHVLDSFLGFADALGITQRATDWSLPLPEAAVARANSLIPNGQRTLIISPCASHPLRNWLPERYAAVADHAQRNQGMQVLLCGGPSRVERDMVDAILAHCRIGPVDLVGITTLPEMQALLARATALLTPDSGPAHMATLAGTPVIGLYAATRAARSGPYLSRQWTVDAYEQAALRFTGKSASQLPWTRKLEFPGVMELITVEQVLAKLDRLMADPEVETAA